MCYVCACACMHYLCMHLFFGFQSLPSIVHASETKLLGNNAGTSVDFTARHLRTPSCGTSARKIVLVISACQAAEPSLGTSAPRRVFNLRQALKLQTFARIRPHQPSCGRNLCGFAPGCVRHLHVLSKATTKRGSEFKKLRSYQTFGEPNK